MVVYAIGDSLLPSLTPDRSIRVRVGCEFRYTSEFPIPLVALVEPMTDASQYVVNRVWTTTPSVPIRSGRDLYGNAIRRMVLPPGDSSIAFDAVVACDGHPDETDMTVLQPLPDDLPDDVLTYVLPSRFCVSDQLSDDAWRLFGTAEPGWQRVQAISDWVHDYVTFGYEASDPTATALDTFKRGRGVCRDFAHLAISMCRALNVPARYVFGYLPDIGVEPLPPPMDFSAWMEVYLGDRWWTFDPRNNQRRIGHIVVARGRDAGDVPMILSFGSAVLGEMIVWADQIA